MSRTIPLIIMIVLLGTLTVDARLWYDSDTTDEHRWTKRIPIILNETIGLERVNEPILLRLNNTLIKNKASIRLVDPQATPDRENEVGGNDLVYQINDDELLFLGNVSENTQKLYYLYYSNDPEITEPEFFSTGLNLTWTRQGIEIENRKAIWEITSASRYMSVSRYENKEYKENIASNPGLDYGHRISSEKIRDSFPAYAKNWGCTIIDEGPVRARINCSANSSTYKVTKTYSFYPHNLLFEVTETLERLNESDKEIKDVRLEINNNMKPYFNHTSSYKTRAYQKGLRENKTFYIAARDKDNGTGEYVLITMGKGNFDNIALRDRRNYDTIQYHLHLQNKNKTTGTIRYLLKKGDLWDAWLEYKRFTTNLTQTKKIENNNLEIQEIRDYDRVYDRNKPVEVKVKTNQVYGTEKIICRIKNSNFTLHDDGTYGDAQPRDNTWTNNKGFQITEDTLSGACQIECKAVDRKNNTASGEKRFRVLDQGRHHRLHFKTESLRIRPGGVGRIYLNITNTGDYSENNISIHSPNPPEGWEIKNAEAINLGRNESGRLFLELKVPIEQKLGTFTLLVGVGGEDVVEVPEKVAVEVALFEIEIDADVKDGWVNIKLRDEYGNPVENAEVTVTHGNRSELLHSDGGGGLRIKPGESRDIAIDARGKGYIPLTAEISLREKEENIWFPVTATVILSLTLLLYWSYRKNPNRDETENAIAVALVIGVIVTLIWVGLVMKGKEPFTALYFAEGSYSNHLYGNTTSFRYVVDCREHEAAFYELKVLLNNKIVERDSFWLGRGDKTQVMKLERSKVVEVPGNLIPPAKVGVILNNGNKSYNIHYFLRDKIIKAINESIGNLTCGNGVLDVNETDIDCGGDCMPCDNQMQCRYDIDCLSGFCSSGRCMEPDCGDGVLNQNEIDVDCGGNCRPCHCFDRVRNLLETDVDCGGPCRQCLENQACHRDGDCITGWCRGGVCRIGNCSDGIMNRGETAVDCGGPCESCPTCTDGIQNQGEIYIDCGGPCESCDKVYINEPHITWIREVDGLLTSVSISNNSRYLVAGSNTRKGEIHLLDTEGKLLGENRAGENILDVGFIKDRYITVYPGSRFFLFDLNARVVGISTRKMIPDLGEICGQPRGEDFLRLGKTGPVWDKYEIPGRIHRFRYTPDCSYKAEATTEDYNESRIRLYKESKLLWDNETPSSTYSIDLTDDGEYIVYGAGEREPGGENHIYLRNKKGRLLQKWGVDWNVYALSISDTGYVTAGTRNGTIYIFERDGGCLWKYKAAEEAIIDIDATPDGRKIVAGSVDGTIYYITNPQPNCFDGILNQNETDVDCGGVCEPCDVRKGCRTDGDCLSGWCYYETCTNPTCHDTVQNQDEEDIDCGGVCRPCAPICYNDSMCGEYTLTSYCFRNYVMRNHTTYYCINPGTIDSYCDAVAEKEVYELCTGGSVCIRGECVKRS